MTYHRVPVLIVGGGYAGLSAALLPAWRDIPVMLVERQPGTSLQPKPDRGHDRRRPAGQPRHADASGRPRRLSRAARRPSGPSSAPATTPRPSSRIRTTTAPCWRTRATPPAGPAAGPRTCR
ncbi:FAD-dependent monooxygenase [Nonomuraea harbinensis]|uniref:FAD-dependent monooxygenase n=1 Tax=Nonomuraea harbinensis TaxID=1286938 RepID=A0ABW1BWS7_9ACTN|nr:FAD-dependent monooxygenase [Nonomuraea harbinensis]